MILIAGAFIGGYFYGRRAKKVVKVPKEVEEMSELRKSTYRTFFRF